MNRLVVVAFVISISIGFVFGQGSYHFVNGKWYDGVKFSEREFYSANGIFSAKRPEGEVTTVDLKGGYVIPPLADAHTHNLDGKFNADRMIREYLAEGTFYVQVLTNYPDGAAAERPRINKPSSVDVLYANGGLTSTLGHPFIAYEPRASGFFNPAEWKANMEKIKLGRVAENRAYWFFDTKADVDAKWPKFLAQKPDLVKIYLLNSDKFEQFRSNGEVGDKGLSPEVAEYIVAKAKAANLRVYAHIETAADFRLGVKLGIDGFAHSPFYGWDGKEENRPKDDLTAQDLKAAAKKKIVVIPTAQMANIEAGGDNPENKARFTRVVERQKKLFRMMLDSGVRLAIGSDWYLRGLTTELEHWYANQILDNATLLRVVTEMTPQTIYPGRKIGKLKAGYEASFIVLEEDPLADFSAVKNISLRFKQGSILELPAAPATN